MYTFQESFLNYFSLVVHLTLISYFHSSFSFHSSMIIHMLKVTLHAQRETPETIFIRVHTNWPLCICFSWDVFSVVILVSFSISDCFSVSLYDFFPNPNSISIFSFGSFFCGNCIYSINPDNKIARWFASFWIFGIRHLTLISVCVCVCVCVCMCVCVCVCTVESQRVSTDD